MATLHDLVALLRIYTLRTKKHFIDFNSFVLFAEKYADQHRVDRPALASYAKDSGIVLATQVDELQDEKRCTIIYKDGKIDQVVFPEFFAFLLQREYSKVEGNSEIPFPTEDRLGVVIPNEFLKVVNIKSDFVTELGNENASAGEILRLVFPEGISSVVVPANQVERQLAKMCVGKIQKYLSSSRNAGYMHSRLQGIFRGREQLLRDMINNIIAAKRQPTDSLFTPTDFSFKFWTHLANAIIQEYREKNDKMEFEHNYCQAAYLLGYYNVYYKGIVQRERDSELALKSLETKLHRAPYVYTLSDIYGIKDGQGVPLTKKYSESQLHRFLEDKTAPGSGTKLPEIIRLRTTAKKEFYIAKEVVLPLTLKKIEDASADYRKHYIDLWERELKEYKKTDVMKDESSFGDSIEELMREENPLLYGLLNYDLLYLCKDETGPKADVAREIDRILDNPRKQLIPLPELLKLSRRELLSRARSSLPFWQSISIFYGVMSALRKMFGGSKSKRNTRKKKAVVSASASKVLGDKTEKSTTMTFGGDESDMNVGGMSAKARQASLQKTIARLKVEMVGTDQSVERRMEELMERWNPLFDPVAKENLVEDVNSMIRDFVRKLKRGFLVKHPDAPRIRNLAESLSENQAFAQIKRKDYLKSYIEAYMLKILG